MTMNDWRRRLLELERAVRDARARLVPMPGPLESERAYRDLQQAESELNEHYAKRPLWAA